VSPRRADAELLAATAIWGVSFVVLKGALAAATPLAFVALRFALAAAVVAPLVPRDPWRVGELRAGLVLAALMSVGFACQMVGLAGTTPARSAFIVATSSVLAPAIAAVWLRERPGAIVLAALVLAAAGIYLLTDPEAGGLNRGDAWTMITAVAFGAQIVAVTRYAGRYAAVRLVWLQIGGTAIAVGVAAALLEPVHIAWSLAFGGALAYTALAATALALWLQMRAQRAMSATRAAVLFCAEALCAAAASWWWLGERLSTTQWAGAGGILIAMVVVESPLGRRGEGGPAAG
jgi:drug/metabolite transporter (DMT)-like permease